MVFFSLKRTKRLREDLLGLSIDIIEDEPARARTAGVGHGLPAERLTPDSLLRKVREALHRADLVEH